MLVTKKKRILYLLKEELEGQANDSADILNFRYVFTIDEIE